MENLDALIEDYGNIYDVVKFEFLNEGKLEEALEILEKEGCERDLDCNFLKIEIYFQLGLEEYNKSNYKKSLECFNYVTNALPNWAVAYNHIGLIYAKTKEYENAIENFEKAIHLSDNRFADAYYNLGYIYHVLEQEEMAKKYYNWACELDEESNYSYYEN